MDIKQTAINGDILSDARRAARLTIDQAAALAGIHPDTYKRQESGATRVHLAVYRLLLIHAGEHPDPAFFGWRVWNGHLWNPDGVAFGPGEIQSLPYLHQLVAELRRQLREHWQRKTPAGAGVRAIPWRR